MNEPFGNSEQLGTDAWNGWDARARLDNEAPARIWLQIDTAGDNDERDVPWPGSEHVTWQDESIGGLEVEYVRADLAARQPLGVGQASPAAVPVDVYAAYETWPADIRAKLSLHDLRRMSGWVAKSPIADWRIDTSAGGPILVYKDCSVIEGEDARYVLSLIERDQPPVCCTQDGKDWNGNPIATQSQPAAAP